jgi:alkanesulfonate monooxygenase SsuD/methylene tetrahydromethanopterin reductase-like flavin-dependent oxidoreductase (luciferase family)
VALAGCGGEETATTPTPQADDFITEANMICAETESAAEQYNDEIESAGLHSPESARYLRRAAAAERRGLERLREVTPPQEDAARYQDFLRSYEVNLVKLEQVAASIESGDTDEAQRIEEDVNASTDDESNPLAAELGIDDCASG